MGDAINPLTNRHLSGRPAQRGQEQTEWDRNNPDYIQRWNPLPRPQQPGPVSGLLLPDRRRTRGTDADRPRQAPPGWYPNADHVGPGLQMRPEDRARRNQDIMRRYGPGGPPPTTRPGAAQPRQSAYDTSTPYPTHGQQGPATNRPPPFQASTQNFDGTQSQMPDFRQRDAFIAQINNQLGQMQQQSWQQPGMGAPQFNFPQMWGQAGQMAQQGWQNPFAQR